MNDGYQSVNGTTETHVNWAIALLLKAALEKDGLTVVMTKSREDELVKNARRARIANEAGALLMLRIHADYGSGSGFRVFYPGKAGRHEGVTGPSAEVQEASRRAAEAIRAGLAETAGKRIHNNGVATESGLPVSKRFGALIGSIHSLVPTITIETGFLNNRADAAFLKSSEGRQLLANGMAKGVQAFIRDQR